MPGTQTWRIKKAATAYIEQDLKNGERICWGKIQRKVFKIVNNKTCTYAEVKYAIASGDGNKYKTLYLLLSEDCDSLYSVSENSSFKITHYEEEYFF
jgi:hypothetical protein